MKIFVDTMLEAKDVVIGNAAKNSLLKVCTVEKTVKPLCENERYRPVIINLMPRQDSNLSHF